MIKEDDIKFHIPENVPYDWAETGFFYFYIPEANIMGLVYIVHRAGVGATVADIEIIDRWSVRVDDALYVDLSNHNPLPEAAEEFTLPNGLSFKALSLREYQFNYDTPDVSLDLHLKSLMEPYDIHDPDMDPMAVADPIEAAEVSGFGTGYASHFDMSVAAKGSLRLGEKNYSINCIATMDHSWGPRPETNLGAILWVNAHFSENYCIHGVFTYDPGAPSGHQHQFRHGYALVDGKVRGLTAGRASATRDGIYAKAAEITVTDIDGRDHQLKGEALTNHPWLPYSNCLSPVTLMRWENNEASEGYGTFMEGFPTNRLRRQK